MTDADLLIQNTLEANPLREPVFRSIIQSLHLPPGSRGLDAGCGIGLQALLLAQAVGPVGQIVGMDILPELLDYGNMLARQVSLSNRISFCAGDITRLPFEQNAFDWAWSADCIGYPLGELSTLLEELKRVLKPGGTVVLLGWTSQQILPGYPILEASLNATTSAYIPFLEGKDSQLHFLRAARWLREAGLQDLKAQTFVGEVRAPLDAGQRAALLSLFAMLWEQPQPGVPAKVRSEYRRLCDPASPDFILDIPDYYAFFTYTLFSGKVVG
jgi:demethylmenaquinone methyltransferase/2-methoxy-6-polyprenyl-1,4-benzoquinol methylase